MSLNYSHLPAWLEQNRLFRTAFLFRKLFLTKRRSHFYGQEAEDIAIRKFFPKRYQGFFVDVGCFHPIKYSNTYRFYRQGWRGINIDVDSIKIEGFNWVRPGDINIARAVSDQKGELEYWQTGFYSLMNTVDKDVAETRSNCRRQVVPADTLTNIIDETKYKDRPIDLLSIDVEGHDFTVLKSLDIERYQPQVIAIETYAGKLDEVLELDIYKYLKARGYDLVSWAGLSLIFRRVADAQLRQADHRQAA